MVAVLTMLRAMALLGGFASGGAVQVDKFTTPTALCGYTPLTDVRDYAVLDLDHEAVRHRLTLGQIPKARNLYEMGGNSFPVARLSLSAPRGSFFFPAGTMVYGEAKSKGHTVSGTLLEDVSWETGFAGNVILLVAYSTSLFDGTPEEQQCRVGGYYTFQRAHMTGCFTDESGSVELVLPNQSPGTGEIFAYSYDLRHDNIYHRTLQTLSTDETQGNKACKDCPYFDDFAKYVDFYGSVEFGDQWILSAASRGTTDFVRGGADFRNAPKIAIAEAIIIGILMLNVFPRIIQGVEQASAKCKQTCNSLLCNEDAMQNLDQSVALYCGSVEGEAGTGEGVFQFALAQRRSAEFGVNQPGKTTNDRIMALFRDFQDFLLQGDCASILDRKKHMISLLKVPLVQSVLRFAYLRDHVLVMGVDDLPKAEAFGATYAAAVLPLVHACHRADATVIQDHLMMGSETSSVDFHRVKEAMEKNYECLEVSCSDVGGIWTEEGFAEGAEPCVDGRTPFRGASSASTGAVSFFGISAVTTVFILIAYIYMKRMRATRVGRHHSRAPSGGIIAAVSSIS